MERLSHVRSGIISAVVILVLQAGTAAYAEKWTCPCGRESFDFDPRDQAHKANWIQIHLAAHCTGSTTVAGTNNSAVQALSPLAQTVFNSIGQSLANAIFGNPQQKRQLEQLRDQEQARLAEELRQRASERRKRELELRDQLIAQLKLSDKEGPLLPKGFDNDGPDGDLTLKGIDDMSLVPAGTPFFGLGGDAGSKQGPEGPPAEASPVNLANLRRASFLAQKAVEATADDAEALLDEAVAVAEGKTSFVAIDDSAAPIISEEGLLAFQSANNEYRRATDAHLKSSQQFVDADRNYKISAEAVRQMYSELEQAKSAGSSRWLEKQRLFDELMSAYRKMQRLWREAKSHIEEAQSSVSWANLIRRKMLWAVASHDSDQFVEILGKERSSLKPTLLEREGHGDLRDVRVLFTTGNDWILKDEYGFLEDKQLTARLQSIVDRLIAVSDYPHSEKIDVKIVDYPKRPAKARGLVETAAGMGNSIYVGRKYLSRVPPPSDEELLFVLGHELAHIQKDHNWESLKELGFEFLQSPDPRELFTRGAFEWLPDPDYRAQLDPQKQALIEKMGKNARWANWTQAHELEADRWGAKLAFAAGGTADGIRDAFNWMEGWYQFQIDENNRIARERNLKGMAPAQRRIELEAGTVPGMTSQERKLIDLTNTHPRPRHRYEALCQIWGASRLRDLESN